MHEFQLNVRSFILLIDATTFCLANISHMKKSSPSKQATTLHVWHPDKQSPNILYHNWVISEHIKDAMVHKDKDLELLFMNMLTLQALLRLPHLWQAPWEWHGFGSTPSMCSIMPFSTFDAFQNHTVHIAHKHSFGTLFMHTQCSPIWYTCLQGNCSQRHKTLQPPWSKCAWICPCQVFVIQHMCWTIKWKWAG